MRSNWAAIFWKMVSIHVKEFYRNGLPLFFSLVMPSMFLLIFGIAESLVAKSQPSYLHFFVPSVLALGMVNLCIFGTATPLVAEKEKGILKQYAITPIPFSAMISSHVIVRLVIALLQGILALAIAGFLFKITVEGSYLLLSLLYIVSAVALILCGYSLAGLFNRLSTATVCFMILNFYILSFGQIFIDLRGIPALKWLIYTTPASSVSDLIRQVMMDEPGNLSIVANMGILGAWMGLAYWSSVRSFRFLPAVD